MMKDELLDESVKQQLSESSKNKILLVTHSVVLEALSSKGVTTEDVSGEGSAEPKNGKSTFIDAKFFENCEVYPYSIPEDV